jgi:hypothetical protein
MAALSLAKNTLINHKGFYLYRKFTYPWQLFSI